MKKLIFVLLAVFIIVNSVFAQWVQTNGPMGGNVNCFLYYNNKLYSGFNSGACYSTNHGISWSKIEGLSGKEVRAFAHLGTSIFAGTGSNGVFVSTNDGLNWSAANGGLSNLHIRSLAVNGSNLIAGIETFNGSGGVFRSTNNGQNWTASLSSANIWSVHSAGSYVYAGTPGQGIYISTDGGITFASSNTGLTDLYVYSIASSGGSIFTGTSTSIFKSTNNGLSWFASGSGITSGYIRCLNVSGTNIFAGTTTNIYLSTNGGTSWAEVMTGLQNSFFNVIYSYGANTFTGNRIGIYLTTNNGALWIPRNGGFIAQSISDLAYINGILFASTYGSGLYSSSDNGDTWLTNSISNNNLSFLITLSNYVFVVSSGGIYKSTNYGVNWNLTGYTKNNIEAVTASGNSLFVGTHDNGVCRSTNYGDTWDTVNTGLSSHDITGMGSNNGKIYAGTYGEGTFKSTDNGNTWTSINFVGHIMGFAFDGDNIMIGRCDSIFRTTNNGITWQPVCAGLHMFCENTRLYQSGSNIFVTSCGSLYLTTNFGTNWKFKGQGIENYNIGSFAFGTDKVFAGIYSASVWKRELTEIIGIKNISSVVPDKFSLSQNFPNPFNPSTNIRYQITNNRYITLKIYDALGKEIETLVNEKHTPGTYEVTWDGSNYPSGVYYYKLTAGDYSETKKMVLVK
jgi:photosystem II stability/assembly factor-like uncharacterized protein